MIAGWQSFEMEDLGDGKVAFRAANGQYVCVEEGSGCELMANRYHLSGRETFSLIEI